MLDFGVLGFWYGGVASPPLVVVFPGHVDYYAEMSETVGYYATASETVGYYAEMS